LPDLDLHLWQGEAVTSRSEAAANLLERNMWAFHLAWYFYFIVAGVEDLLGLWLG
jgi:hypothetical protein